MKVVIVDDHPVVREGISSILSLDSDIEVSGEASNIAEAVKVINSSKPDLVLIDIKLGKENGLDIINKINSVDCKLAVITSSIDINDFEKAEQFGVDGYIIKDAFLEEILNAVKIINRGRKYYDSMVLSFLNKRHQHNVEEKLTNREKEVLIAIRKGMKNKEIARQLFISEYTVKKHVSQVLAKLKLKDRTQAALYAISNGYISNK